MRFAALFPGHGIPDPDITAAWAAHDEQRLVARVAHAGGLDPSRLVAARAGDDPVAVECAVFATSLLAWEVLRGASPVTPAVVAGHDLGEVTAAVAAGALTVEDGAALVAERAGAVHRAADLFPAGVVAVLDLDDPAEHDLLDRLPPDVTLADDNAPGQIVLAGPERQLQVAVARAQALGGRVRVPDAEPGVHSPSMTPVLVELAATLSRIELRSPVPPLATAVTGEVVADSEGLRRVLAEGVLAPVRWRQLVESLADTGLGGFLEIGPGVLHDLAHRTVVALPACSLGVPTDLTAVCRWLAGGPPPPSDDDGRDAVAAG